MMSYLDYLTHYPDVYLRFSRTMNRTESLLGHLRAHRVLDGVNDLISIGAGDGELELAIAEQQAVAVSVIEPAQLLHDRFLQRVSTSSANLLYTRTYCCSFEDFHTDQKFDLVMFIHSWYAFGFDTDMLDKALFLVRKGGRLFITVAAKESPVSDISGMSSAGGIALHADALADFLRRRNYDFGYSIEHNYRPFSLYVQDNQLTHAGKDFTSFLIATPFGDLDEIRQQNALESFLGRRRGDVIDIPSGCLLFEC